MAAALTLLSNLESFRETVAGAADKVKGAVVEKTKSAVGKAKEMVGLVSEEELQQQQQQSQAEQGQAGTEDGWMEELNQWCNLTYKQRLYGFVSCLGLGLLCSVMSLFVLFHPVKFAIAYSFGNLLAIASTGFLIGFQRQLKMMFDPVRVGAAVVFIIAIVLSLFAALYVQDPLLTLLCIIVQGAALLWYSLSYIPYAQAAAKRIARACYESEF